MSVGREILAHFKSTNEPDHREILESEKWIGGLLVKRGDFTEAAVLFQRVLEVQERTLGPGHLATLATVKNLADLRFDTCDFATAETLYRRVLDGRDRTLGRSSVAQRMASSASGTSRAAHCLRPTPSAAAFTDLR
jgi:hypothetical protein